MKKEIWNVIKQDLIGVTSACRVWLDGAELVHLTDGIAVIYVPSDFARTVVSERFGDRIAACLTDFCGRPVNVCFIGKDELFSFAEPKKQEEDPIRVELTNLMVDMREVGKALDQLIAQLDCIIEDIENM